MAGANNQQAIASTVGTTIYDPANDGRCAAIRINCHSTSAVSVLINVAGIHAVGEFEEIEKGQSLPYRSGLDGIGKVTAKVAAGNATIGWSKLAVL